MKTTEKEEIFSINVNGKRIEYTYENGGKIITENLTDREKAKVWDRIYANTK